MAMKQIILEVKRSAEHSERMWRYKQVLYIDGQRRAGSMMPWPDVQAGVFPSTVFPGRHRIKAKRPDVLPPFSNDDKAVVDDDLEEIAEGEVEVHIRLPTSLADIARHAFLKRIKASVDQDNCETSLSGKSQPQSHPRVDLLCSLALSTVPRLVANQFPFGPGSGTLTPLQLFVMSVGSVGASIRDCKSMVRGACVVSPDSQLSMSKPHIIVVHGASHRARHLQPLKAGLGMVSAKNTEEIGRHVYRKLDTVSPCLKPQNNVSDATALLEQTHKYCMLTSSARLDLTPAVIAVDDVDAPADNIRGGVQPVSNAEWVP
ncbi:uncharacterized protein MYCFIDRAFT_207605 [Pseudocercospora fijiensis CIRAD86]|uniref:Uncharacterized protein n=1 Tax=Pseudocercospora fijiensis (strain CIRAD86) TaxID=383855 RepID=M2YYR7_PSEFD|nr:uncharacterized protein MYCFIDRAFT_207605 [Pseudocercospora fijiensis CIRAD86]EME82770.1 hypothetical protein MYCFIDRAFT_207605 [Pseudocercospora fijiensis CIRAD86]